MSIKPGTVCCAFEADIHSSGTVLISRLNNAHEIKPNWLFNFFNFK